jgi:deferrochelatase/peroxidase EfeB
MLERDDIQGLVFSGYARRPHARYFFLRFPEAGAAAWLSRVIPRVTSADRQERTASRSLNLAFTASGLGRLWLPESALATFPPEFLQGMAAPERVRALGDAGASAPAGWEFGATDAGRVDAVVLSYATTEAELDDESETLEQGFEQHGIEAWEEDTYLPADRRGHFGFLDARSNPRLFMKLRRRERDPLAPRVPLGEFVLGYRNAYGHRAPSPTGPLRTSTRALPPVVDALRAMDLGRNGTFVALRKLEQDVAGFWRFVRSRAEELFPEAGAHGPPHLAACLVGRTLDGARTPNCPVGAHVSRANPRDALGDDPKQSLATVRKHRLIRRGRLYGPKLALDGLTDAPPEALLDAPPDAEPRGLLFLGLCADLARQYEFLHEAWLDNPKFGGLTRERDPLVGSALAPGDAGPDTFSLQGEPFRRTFALERFVRVRGGAYLFMPGLRALSYLAEG